VNKARSYAYLKPPEGVRPPFVITVKVPSEEQAKEIFQALYAQGKTWAGYIGDWPAIYLHDHGYKAISWIMILKLTVLNRHYMRSVKLVHL
jgi:hypothetical protein